MTQTTFCPHCGGSIALNQNGAAAPKEKYPEGFSRWWKAYAETISPRSMVDKPKAVAIWRKMGAEPHADWMIKVLANQEEYRRYLKEKKEFVAALPSAERYLRLKRFEEEIPNGI